MFPGLVMVFVIDGLAMRIHRDSLRAKARANDHGKRAIVLLIADDSAIEKSG